MSRRGRFGKYGELKRKARLRRGRVSELKGRKIEKAFGLGRRKARKRKVSR